MKTVCRSSRMCYRASGTGWSTIMLLPFQNLYWPTVAAWHGTQAPCSDLIRYEQNNHWRGLHEPWMRNDEPKRWRPSPFQNGSWENISQGKSEWARGPIPTPVSWLSNFAGLWRMRAPLAVWASNSKSKSRSLRSSVYHVLELHQPQTSFALLSFVHWCPSRDYCGGEERLRQEHHGSTRKTLDSCYPRSPTLIVSPSVDGPADDQQAEPCKRRVTG